MTSPVSEESKREPSLKYSATQANQLSAVLESTEQPPVRQPRRGVGCFSLLSHLDQLQPFDSLILLSSLPGIG